MKKIILHIGLVMSLVYMLGFKTAIAQRKNLIFESTFDTPASITSWYERSILNPWSATIVTDKIRAGKGSLKVDLIRGKDILNGPRAELGMAPQTKDEFWYGFANFFPTDYSSDPAPEIINQWQAKPDLTLGEAWRSPPLGLEITSDRYRVAIRWAADKINTVSNTSVEYVDLGPVEHNKWNDWVFHIKWGYKSGTLQVWKNGKLILARLNKPIGYNDILFPYLKIGIYKWEWSNPLTISTAKERSYYIDEVRVGNNLATYNDVFPGVATPAPAENTLPIISNSLKVLKNKDGTFTATFIAADNVTQVSKFVLYISVDNGKNYIPTTTVSTVSLVKNQKYTLIFKAK
nr:polysaccharide lyase [Mucilaginibacter sp. L294]